MVPPLTTMCYINNVGRGGTEIEEVLPLQTGTNEHHNKVSVPKSSQICPTSNCWLRIWRYIQEPLAVSDFGWENLTTLTKYQKSNVSNPYDNWQARSYYQN